ncbi:MAG: 2-dehydropantoate 2-reductase [Chloroflexi bacterium]|nr:2-dehydropantoate 2-reductase [Chloroflexota bacterium]
MGCLFGAHLSPHADVTLVGHWPAQRQALRMGHLVVHHQDGRTTTHQLHAVDDPEAIGWVDLALVLTKAHQTQQVATRAARSLKRDGIALTLQNGVGNATILAQAVGSERATQGITTLGASTRGLPGKLYLAGTGSITLATRPEIAPQMERIAALFRQAGLTTTLSDDVRGLIWGKLAVNAAINPLTAILRAPNGALLESTWAQQLAAQAAEEVATVARAEGVTLPFDDAAAYALEVARQTANNQSSMLQDVLRGAITEIDAICGAVIRRGAARDIPTPVNETLHALVKALEETHDHADRHHD